MCSESLKAGGQQETGTLFSTDVTDTRQNIRFTWDTKSTESRGTEFSTDVSDTRCGKSRMCEL